MQLASDGPLRTQSITHFNTDPRLFSPVAIFIAIKNMKVWFHFTTGLITISVRRFSSPTGACKSTGHNQFDAVVLRQDRWCSVLYVDRHSWQLMNIKLHRNHKGRWRWFVLVRLGIRIRHSGQIGTCAYQNNVFVVRIFPFLLQFSQNKKNNNTVVRLVPVSRSFGAPGETPWRSNSLLSPWLLKL